MGSGLLPENAPLLGSFVVGAYNSPCDLFLRSSVLRASINPQSGLSDLIRIPIVSILSELLENGEIIRSLVKEGPTTILS